jgi:hypothetical protein
VHAWKNVALNRLWEKALQAVPCPPMSGIIPWLSPSYSQLGWHTWFSSVCLAIPSLYSPQAISSHTHWLTQEVEHFLSSFCWTWKHLLWPWPWLTLQLLWPWPWLTLDANP